MMPNKEKVRVEKQYKNGKKMKRSRTVWAFYFISLHPPDAAVLCLAHHSSLTSPATPLFPFDLHSTRRACSLLLSPGAREGWSTAQVMRTLSSLAFTVRVSSLLTLYVGSSGSDSTMCRSSEVRKGEDNEEEGDCILISGRKTKQNKKPVTPRQWQRKKALSCN